MRGQRDPKDKAQFIASITVAFAAWCSGLALVSVSYLITLGPMSAGS